MTKIAAGERAGSFDDRIASASPAETLAIGTIVATLPFAGMVLVVQSTLPLLLGHLAVEGRLSDEGIGIAAAVECIAVALASSLSGIFLPLRHVRTHLLVATAAMIGFNLAPIWLHSQIGFILTRGGAGLAEGQFFWITFGMIARTALPARWTAFVNTGGAVGSLIAAATATSVVIPRFGAAGGFALLAVFVVFCALLIPWTSDDFGPLQHSDHQQGAPSARGWLSLLACTLFLAAVMGVFVYIIGLSKLAGMSLPSGEFALNMMLFAQIPGGIAAILIADRVSYFTMLCASALAIVGILLVFLIPSSAAAFIAAATLHGFVTCFAVSFLVTFTVEADPSRRAAIQSGPAFIFGTALGPLFCAFAIAQYGIASIPLLSLILLALAMAVVASLRFTTAPPDRL